MKGCKMSKCSNCNKELNVHDIYKLKTSLCGDCRKGIRRAKALEDKKTKIEACGYNVKHIEVVGKHRDIKCLVICTSCGKERSTYYKNIVVDGRKCSCMHSEARRKLIDSFQTQEVLISVPIEYKVTGIYKISVGDEVYVGSSVNVQNRLRTHFRQIRDKKHTIPMLKAVETHGAEAIRFEVIEECSFEELQIREQYYIDTIKPTINILDDAINPMQDIKLKFATMLGENNSSCKYTNDKIVEVLMELQHSKDLQEVANKLEVGFSLVADMSSGKSYEWLQMDYPEEYRRMLITKGGGYCYQQVVELLQDIVNNPTELKAIAKKNNMDYTNVLHFKNCSRTYMKRMRDNDALVGELYNKIERGA